MSKILQINYTLAKKYYKWLFPLKKKKQSAYQIIKNLDILQKENVEVF